MDLFGQLLLRQIYHVPFFHVNTAKLTQLYFENQLYAWQIYAKEVPYVTDFFQWRHEIDGSRYSIMDQARFEEDSL